MLMLVKFGTIYITLINNVSLVSIKLKDRMFIFYDMIYYMHHSPQVEICIKKVLNHFYNHTPFLIWLIPTKVQLRACLHVQIVQLNNIYERSLCYIFLKGQRISLFSIYWKVYYFISFKCSICLHFKFTYKILISHMILL